MTPADRAAAVVRAKQIASPVVSCVRADVRIGHLTEQLDRDGLLALVAVLAASADPHRLRAVCEAPGDQGMPPIGRDAILRQARREADRLRNQGADVPYQVRILEAEYWREMKRRQRQGTKAWRDAA